MMRFGVHHSTELYVVSPPQLTGHVLAHHKISELTNLKQLLNYINPLIPTFLYKPLSSLNSRKKFEEKKDRVLLALVLQLPIQKFRILPGRRRRPASVRLPR